MELDRTGQKTFVIMGGLGNQLFQYFAGLFYSLKHNTQVSFLLSPNDSRLVNSIPTILDFKLPEKLKVSKYNKGSFMSLKFILKISQQKTVSKVIQKYGKVLIASNVGFIEELNKPTNASLVYGYFQTWKYFELIRQNYKYNVEELDLKAPSVLYKKLREDFTNEKPVVLHIRRGDYKQLNDSYGLLSKEYYLSALSRIKNHRQVSKIWIFSDELKLAKEMFTHSGLDNVTYVDDSNLRSSEILTIMSLSDDLVIANSSFSWWAGMLGNPLKNVYCPAKWFRNLEDPKDLYPPNWNIVDSAWE